MSTVLTVALGFVLAPFVAALVGLFFAGLFGAAMVAADAFFRARQPKEEEPE